MVDVQALIEKQRAIVAVPKSLDVPVEFADSVVTVEVFKLLGDGWRLLKEAHQPRPGVSSDRDAGFNELTLMPAYPAESLRFGGESVTAEQWTDIYMMLEEPAKNLLAGAAYRLHLLDPINRLAELGKAVSGGRSGSPANRASRRAASKGGSQRKSPATTTLKETAPDGQ